MEPKDVSKKHFQISIIKSAIRILGCGVVVLGLQGVVFLAASLLVAELLGIVEEM